MPRIRLQRQIASHGHSLLVIPQPDEGSGTVAVVAYRMGIHRTLDPFPLHRSQRAGEDFVSRSPELHLTKQQILHSIARSEAG